MTRRTVTQTQTAKIRQRLDRQKLQAEIRANREKYSKLTDAECQSARDWINSLF